MAVLLTTIVGVRYSYLTITHQIEPVFTTWFLFTIATSVGLYTYVKSEQKEKGFLTNIANTMDVFVCGPICVCILFFGKSGLVIRVFDVICIILSITVLLFFFWSKNGKTANICINILIAIAYLPTILNLIKAQENTESLGVWFLILLAQTFALIEPIRKRDFLASLYAGRTFIIVLLLLVLMLRLEMRI